MATWIGALGVLIGILGLALAYYQHRQRTRVEKVVRDILRRLAGEVKVVFSNANWADTHFRSIGYLLADGTPDDLSIIRKRVLDGARDSAACARQLSLTHSQIRGIQQALFNDSEEILPEIQTDDVKAASLTRGEGTASVKLTK